MPLAAERLGGACASARAGRRGWGWGCVLRAAGRPDRAPLEPGPGPAPTGAPWPGRGGAG